MFELYLKSWYQEDPNNEQQEVIYSAVHIEDVWEYLKNNGDRIIDEYPIVDFGIRTKRKIKNKLISIGYLGVQTSYLNIDKNEAIKRYCEDDNITIEDFKNNAIDVYEFEFDDEFGSYDIWEK